MLHIMGKSNILLPTDMVINLPLDDLRAAAELERYASFWRGGSHHGSRGVAVAVVAVLPHADVMYLIAVTWRKKCHPVSSG